MKLLELRPEPMNKIGEAVKCDFDLSTAYNVSYIEKLKVLNLSTQKWDDCEHWGFQDGEDFGRIADFDFSISDSETRLFFGESLYYGYFQYNQAKLIVLPRASQIPKDFVRLGCLDLEEYYPAPKTMMDLANQIDNFIYLRTKRKLELQNEHKQAYQAMIKLSELPAGNSNETDDLPF